LFDIGIIEFTDI